MLIKFHNEFMISKDILNIKNDYEYLITIHY